jgi:tight adherence protein B
MELLVSVFFSVLCIVLGLGLWANRQAALRQRHRIAAARLSGVAEVTPRTAAPVRREPARAAASRFPALRWAEVAIAQAGLELSPQTLLLSIIALAIAGPALMAFWPRTPAAAAAGLSFPLVPIIWLCTKRTRRLKTLAHQIPYLLDTLKSALESGHTLLRGLQMAAQNNPEPLAGELRGIVDQVRVGVNLPLALESMCRRVPIEELTFLADAVGVQDEVGSSLAEILEHVAQSIRNRQRLDDQIRVITSQSRMSARIVSALPAIILSVFFLVRPDYVEVLFKNPIGIRMLEAALVMDVVAYFIMREIARVDY